MRILLLLAVVTGLINTGTAWRSFMRGRSKHGNLGTPIVSQERTLPKEKWYTQLLDHFGVTNGGVWQQRYFVNSDFYKQAGPMFLMIGGEGAANPKWMVEGEWIEYAKKFGAMCFLLEHRFYGKSHPTSDLSVKNLMFLSSEQALADLAYFILGMNDAYNVPNGTKWIVFGGSYAGSLAAWMRSKYPHIVHGAVSTSGPLLAEIDFQQYYVVVESALRKHSQTCVDVVAAANHQFHIMLRHPIGQQAIVKKFTLCDPIDPGHTKQVDISNLYETLASNFAGVVQYNKDNRNNSKSANFTVDTICDVLIDETRGLPIDRLALVSNMILNASQEKCLDYRYSKMIHEMRNVTWTSEQAEGGRQWVYQTCTEFGFFQTSTARPNLFSETFPVEFFIQQCTDIFGPRYNFNVLDFATKRTNIVYGGLNLEVTNVVFVHGSIDPWHVLGITNSTNTEAPSIYIDGTAHCANMYPPSKSDMPQLQEARAKVASLIEKWLQN